MITVPQLDYRTAAKLTSSVNRAKWDHINNDERVFVFDGAKLVEIVSNIDEVKRRRLEWLSLANPYIITAIGTEVKLRNL